MTTSLPSRRSADTEDVLAALCAADSLMREHELHARRLEVCPATPDTQTIIDGTVVPSRPTIYVHCPDELALAGWLTATGAASVLVSCQDERAGLQIATAHGAFHWRVSVMVVAASPFLARLQANAEPGQSRFPAASLRAALALPEPATT